MALTVEQIAEISAQLSVDLSLQADDRLIELCLLYRSAKEALPSFPALLEAEITRRFTAIEIDTNDVMFSVIQTFLNRFKHPDEPYAEVTNLTSGQITAITSKLSVVLSAQTDERLIELCLLFKAVPNVLVSFSEALATEITRRFTAVEIAANDVMFSVTQNFSNNFLPMYMVKTREMLASANKDAWFQSNTAIFTEYVNTPKIMDWILTNPDVVTAMLSSQYGVEIIGGSLMASTAILNHPPSLDIFKAVPNIWSRWVLTSQGMDYVLTTDTLSTYMCENNSAIDAAIKDPTSFNKIISSSSILKKCVNSSVSRLAFVNNNTTFQSARNQLIATVRLNWVKYTFLNELVSDTNVPFNNINAAVVSPEGFVFVNTGKVYYAVDGVVTKHFNGEIASVNIGLTALGNLSRVDSVSFNNSKYSSSTEGYGQAYMELWKPPT